jgi:acyl carrier protein
MVVSDVREKILEIIKQELDFHQIIHDESKLEEIGVDSIAFISIIIAIEEEFSIRFDDKQIIYNKYQTIGDLVVAVQSIIE